MPCDAGNDHNDDTDRNRWQWVGVDLYISNLLEGRGTGLVKQGRRYILDHRRSLHSVKLSSNEVLALYLAARLLARHSDEHNPLVIKALEKLADALDARSPLMAQHIAQAAAAVRSRRTRREYVEALEVLMQGWAEGRKVRLRYRSYTKAVLGSSRAFQYASRSRAAAAIVALFGR